MTESSVQLLTIASDTDKKKRIRTEANLPLIISKGEQQRRIHSGNGGSSSSEDEDEEADNEEKWQKG